MFNRLSFKGQPEAFSLSLGYADADTIGTSSHGGTIAKDRTVVEWQSTEPDDHVLQKIASAINDPEVVSERVVVRLQDPGSRGFVGVVSAASAHHSVQLRFEIESSKPQLRSVELSRLTGNGSISTALGLDIWSLLDLQHVTRLRCNEGVTSLWDRNLLERFSSLRVLNLSHAKLAALPGVIGSLTKLQELRLEHNSLKILPPEIGKLSNLRVLAIDHNEVSILPGELRLCASLEEFSLENNKLTSVLLSFGSLRKLRTLRLADNQLEFLPEIGPCKELRSLSVANLRVQADQEYSHFKVELMVPAYSGPGINIFDSGKNTDKLRPIFSLMLRRSSGHHPLLAGAFRQLAEEPKNRELMAKQENALQQLILMALNDDSMVVAQTCQTLSLLAKHSSALAEAILDTDAGTLAGLVQCGDPVKQLASLGVMAVITLSLGEAHNRLLGTEVINAVLGLATDGAGSLQLRVAALKALGNFGFSRAGQQRLSSDAKVMGDINSIIDAVPAVDLRVKAAAIRVLAIVGDVTGVARAVGRPAVQGRGLRILSMDGGGMKGMATVRHLRRLEALTGRPIHALFDLIVGTSTGGLLAVALGLRKFSLDECEHVYKVLGQRVFSRPSANKEKEETWMEAFYRTFHSKTQHVRAVVVGYKHDASVYETMLKEYCSFANDPRQLSDCMIDTASLDVPKVALVSTLASASPAAPFVFRNYELPPNSEDRLKRICFHPGSSQHTVWQAVRASSAAIYYLDDFNCGGEKFQDGAVVANNPGMVALQEARALWPDAPIDVFLSIGTGSTPTARRDKGLNAFMDTGNILIESATNVERVHEALATATPLIPNLKYFRFNPVDARCSMELDEVDPRKWAVLEEATDAFIEETAAEFEAAAAALMEGRPAAPLGPSRPGEHLRSRVFLGLNRRLMVVTATPLVSEPAPVEVAAAACARLIDDSLAVDLQGLRERKRRHGEQAANIAGTSLSAAERDGQLAAAPSSDGNNTTNNKPAVIELNLGGWLGSWFSPQKSLPRGVAAEPEEQGPQAAPQSPSRADVQRELVFEDEVQSLEQDILDAVPSVGIIHLALRSTADGLVLRWKDAHAAVTVPSSEADEIVRHAGYDPSTITLDELFEQSGGELAVGHATMRVLSKQYRRLLNGSLVSVILVHTMAPGAILDAECIVKMTKALLGRLVVCSNPVPEPVVAAFTAAGVLAVIAPPFEQQSPSDVVGIDPMAGCSMTSFSSFFGRLYSDLQAGADVALALQRAEEAHQGLLDGAFKLYLNSGSSIKYVQH